MKFRFFTVPCTLLVAVALVLTACTKEGPAGPAGAQGPEGPTGPAGPSGPTGPAGSVNVFYSNWLDVTFEGSDTSGFTAEIAAPLLADSILARGEVRVYLNIGTAEDPTVLPLPLDATAFGAIITPIFEIGLITLIASDDVSTFTNTNNQKSLQYRYVIIPGGTPASTGFVGGRAAKINWNNYSEVQSYLGLKD
jgi:hypothetical protein